MSTWNLPPGVTTNDPHINPRNERQLTILEGCNELGLSYPVSAADLHEVYAAFVLEGIEPNTASGPCWRGVCTCLESYGTDPMHAGARARIMEHLELLSPKAP